MVCFSVWGILFCFIALTPWGPFLCFRPRARLVGVRPCGPELVSLRCKGAAGTAGHHAWAGPTFTAAPPPANTPARSGVLRRSLDFQPITRGRLRLFFLSSGFFKGGVSNPSCWVLYFDEGGLEPGDKKNTWTCRRRDRCGKFDQPTGHFSRMLNAELFFCLSPSITPTP